jgi:hypothetical protein
MCLVTAVHIGIVGTGEHQSRSVLVARPVEFAWEDDELPHASKSRLFTSFAKVVGGGGHTRTTIGNRSHCRDFWRSRLGLLCLMPTYGRDSYHLPACRASESL